jgi:hypothetical protein
MERILKELVEKLKKAYPSDLVCVVLYGSAAVGERNEQFSDYNVLCVLSEIGRQQLSASAPIFRWWREHGNPAPLLMTQEEMRRSTDCFPIEFTDIRDYHQILYGADLVAGIEVSPQFYRAQVEYELRSKLFRLRQKAGGLFTDKDLLRTLLADSVSTFCVLLRHALRLSGHPVAFHKREIVAAAALHFGLEGPVFDRLLDLRDGKIKPRDLDPIPAFEAYLREISKVIETVDRIAA